MEETKRKRYQGLLLAGVSAAFWALVEWQVVDLVKEIRREVREPVEYSARNEGKPVFVTGRVVNGEEIKDEMFFVKKNCMRLERNVEKFQDGLWREEDAQKVMVRSAVMQVEAPYEIPPFKVSSEYMNKLVKWRVRNEEMLKFIKKRLRKVGFAVFGDRDYIYLSRFDRKSGIYTPTNGDQRVSHHYIPSNLHLSILAKQENGFLTPYKGVFLLKHGHATPEDLLSEVPHSLNPFLYTSRAVCPLLITLGLYSYFHKPN